MLRVKMKIWKANGGHGGFLPSCGIEFRAWGIALEFALYGFVLYTLGYAKNRFIGESVDFIEQAEEFKKLKKNAVEFLENFRSHFIGDDAIDQASTSAFVCLLCWPECICRLNAVKPPTMQYILHRHARAINTAFLSYPFHRYISAGTGTVALNHLTEQTILPSA